MVIPVKVHGIAGHDQYQPQALFASCAYEPLSKVLSLAKSNTSSTPCLYMYILMLICLVVCLFVLKVCTYVKFNAHSLASVIKVKVGGHLN